MSGIVGRSPNKTKKKSEKHLAFGGRIGYNTIRSASAEFAGVAQLVERVIGNDEVHGSDSHHQLHGKPAKLLRFSGFCFCKVHT